MFTQPTNSFYDKEVYDTVLRVAAVPVLVAIIVLCWFITNTLMSARWQERRRNKQIRKAVAARNARLARSKAEEDANASDATRTPTP